MANILSLEHNEARNFFLDEKSYFSLDLPVYFEFTKLISELDKKLQQKTIVECFYNSSQGQKKPEYFEKVNYRLLNNKNGEYSWRPFQIIHPVLYVKLVHLMTQKNNWLLIKERFIKFQQNACVECTSIPVVSIGKKSSKSKQVSHWWEELEQKSISLGLDFEYLFETDIEGCYNSIYTHSVPWALHTKPVAKEKRKDTSLVGNMIDYHLSAMSNGQTNGIPQGSILMDFIAEIVLGYGDMLLCERLSETSPSNYKILRYRDDYRVFVNNPQIGKRIIKELTEILSDLGMRLNAHKTKYSNNVIQSSLKPDKFYSINNNQRSKNLQKELFIISNLASKFPNSGSISTRLQNFYNTIERRKKISHIPVLISILVDIGLKNPRTYPIIAAILSKFLSFLNKKEQNTIIKKIQKRFNSIPNTGHLEIWLQRITVKIDKHCRYNEPLCNEVIGEKIEIWNSEWLVKDIKKIIDTVKVVNVDKINEIDPIIGVDEVSLFKQKKYDY